MRKLKDALSLKFEGQQSHQQIATALGISKGVVTKYAGLAAREVCALESIRSPTRGALSRGCNSESD